MSLPAIAEADQAWTQIESWVGEGICKSVPNARTDHDVEEALDSKVLIDEVERADKTFPD